ncbi:MAG: PRC-barrel domain-containing protein [Rhodomicrobiaceae bacterium]
MKTLLTSTALVALMAGVSPAMAECNIGKATGYTQQDDAVQGNARRDLRQLRNSAMILNTYGKEDACQQVLSAIEEIRDNRGRMPAAGNQPEATGTTASVEPVDYRQMVANATPVTEFQGRLTVDTMIDSDVRGANGEVLGEIDNIILNNEGQPSHAVVAFGGFLGLGEDRVAIPYSRLKTQTNVRDMNNLTFFVPMSQAQLENAPRVQNDNNWMADESWLSQNDEYYETNSVDS